MKKYLAIILSIYVLVLSVPVCSEVCCVENSECQTEQREQNNSADNCLPFMNCCTCVGFVADNTVCTITKPQETSSDLNMYFPQTYSDAFLNGIWQPPKSA